MSRLLDRRKQQTTQQGKPIRCRQRLKSAKKTALKRDKVSRLIKDAHCRVARWLCDHFHTIVIPDFQVQQMVKRKKRRLRKKTVRSLLTWNHYKFRERLVCTAETTQAYTSKTCSVCGSQLLSTGFNSHALITQ